MLDGPILGIDFGRINSAAAYLRDDDDLAPRELNNQLDKVTTPSVVWFGKEEGTAKVLVGELAQEKLLDDDPRVRRGVLAHVKRDLAERLLFFTGDREVTPVDAVVEILRQFKQDAERVLGRPVTRVVLTYPVVWDALEMDCLRVAARQAGFQFIRLVHEPVAAALEVEREGGTSLGNSLLVFDLGGGTCDLVWLVRDGREPFIVRRWAGERIGGATFDELLYDHVLQLAEEQEKPVRTDGPRSLRLLRQCQDFKEKLCSAGGTLKRRLELPGEQDDDEIRFHLELSRDDLHDLIRPAAALAN